MSFVSPPDPRELRPVPLPPTSPAPELATLPRPLTSLIDRVPELAAIGALLRDPAVCLLTLTGPGGVGKTRLAIAAALETAGRFPDGMTFVRLGALSDPGHVYPTIAHALGLRDMGTGPLSSRVQTHLAAKHSLLILDNFEHLVVASPLLIELLGACPHLTILVTSRGRLRLSGEREYAVPPLTLPEGTAPLHGEEPAVMLFAERARALRPDFAVTPELAPTVIEIVRRLDGLPLAIELAAARVKALPPTALLERLERRLPLLTGGARDLPLRQQTMRDTIAWSYDLLEEEEQALFRRLSVFSGSFTLEAAEYLGGDGFASVLDLLESLVEQSLLRPVAGLPAGPGSEVPRFAMLETVREYARELLDASDDAAQAGRWHLAYYLALAEEAAPALSGPAQADWLDRLEEEHANLRTALRWGLEHEPDQALRLAAALRSFWRMRGHVGEGGEALERALAADVGEPAVRATALVALSSIRNQQGDYAAGAARAAEAYAISTEIGDRRGIAEALRRMAPYPVATGLAADPPDQSLIDRGEALWSEELDLRRELADDHGIAWALHNLGISALARHDPTRTAQLAESLTLFEALGDQYGVAFTITNLARVAALQGTDAKAATLFAQALSMFRDLGDRWGAAHALEDVAWRALHMGPAERAARLLGAAAAFRQADGGRLSLMHRQRHELAVVVARDALGEANFTAAMAAGGQLTVEQAIAEGLETLDTPAKAEAEVQLDGPRLTRREREVLQLLVEGRSDREIAAALSLSPRTVGGHVTNLLGKLGVESRTAATTYALRHGLV